MLLTATIYLALIGIGAVLHYCLAALHPHHPPPRHRPGEERP